MSSQNNIVNKLLKSFSQRPIAYQKIYTQITGSITAGLLLSQIFYWWYAVGEREFYKTDREFADELGMGPKELKTAKGKLKKLKLISTTRKGVPCKTFYRLEKSALLSKIYSWSDSAQLDGPKGTNWMGQKGPTNSEITSDNTTETTKDNKEISQGDLSKADAEARGSRRPKDRKPLSKAEFAKKKENLKKMLAIPAA